MCVLRAGAHRRARGGGDRPARRADRRLAPDQRAPAVLSRRAHAGARRQARPGRGAAAAERSRACVHAARARPRWARRSYPYDREGRRNSSRRVRPVRVPTLRAVATMTRMHPGFTGVVQHEWPRPRGWTPPQLLDARDVSSPGRRRPDAREAPPRLRHLDRARPARSRAAAVRVRRRAGLDREARPHRGRSRDRRSNSERACAAAARPAHARERDRPRRQRRADHGAVLQPAVARREADAGHADPPAREALALRVRGEELRRRRGEAHRRLRARVPGERADPVGAAA